ncbi:MAG: sigma-70 family RNA polymerase sigma factor [Bacteroidales bacterium]
MRFYICKMNEMNSFQHLLEMCRKQNTKACLLFYKMFSQRVYNTCLRIVNHRMEAEEIMQEVFLKTFDTLSYFSGDEKAMQGFIGKIAINKSIDRLRRKNSTLLFLDDMEIDIAEPMEELDNENMKIELIKEKMKLLPPGYRLVLTLHLIEEMNYEEIAQQLSIKSSTVRSQYVRGIRRLREELKEKNHNR